MTVALEGGEWWAARPGRTLPPGKTRYPFYRRSDGPRAGLDGWKILSPIGIRSWTVQPVVSRYTDWATRPRLEYQSLLITPNIKEACAFCMNNTSFHLHVNDACAHVVADTSALALQSICAHISQEECMAVKCRYNIFTYAATECSQARKCTYKQWGVIRRYILNSSRTRLDRQGVTLCIVHKCIHITELLGSVTSFVRKNSSLYGYVDFASVIFISHTWPQNFNVLKYSVVCYLKTILRTHL